MDEEERMDYLETARKYLAESWDNQIQNFNVKIINAKDQRTKEVFETAKDLAIIKKKEALDKFDQKILEQFSFENFGKQLIEIYKDAEKNLAITKQHMNKKK